MATNLKDMGTALWKAMKNPLAQVTKKSEVATAIDDSSTEKLAPNQISKQLDKFENWLIRKRKYQDQ